MTAPTTQATRLRLAAMERLITGVTTAFDYIPRKLEDPELPAFVNFAGDAQYDRTTHGRQVTKEIRNWRCVVYVARLDASIEANAEELVYPFVDRVRDYFLARPGLELDGATNPQTVEFDAEPIGDGGVVNRLYPVQGGIPYAAFELRLRVNSLIQRSYQSGG